MWESHAVIEFGPFRLSPTERELRRDGVPIALGARAMDILLHLASRHGTVVSRRDLMQAAWPGRIVEVTNLTVTMAALRKALAAGCGEGFIKTVTGHGYRMELSAAGPLPGLAPPTASPAAIAPPALAPGLRLIGRTPAVTELKQLLTSQRIVSIIGPGGVGKTVLALHLAGEMRTEFPDGIAFADLSTVTDPARVAEAVAAAALAGGGQGINTATDRLALTLRSARMLLLLDNCERLVEPVAALANAVVAACPRVTILITSREGLFVPDEQIFRLTPLSVDDAVKLFAERARAQGSFEPDMATRKDVAAICERLDGIPLAIEMAVPRLKVLSPAQLAARLDERFRLLGAPGRGTTPRHRTLQAMIDWSYDHLPPGEQALLRTLSAFSGSSRLAAVQALSREDDEVALIDLLTALADKSMLVVEPGEPPRFRLLDSIRHYGLGKAAETGETYLSRRHAVYFAERFAEAARGWPTTPGRDWRLTYAADAENMRHALSWAFGPTGDPEIGVRLVASSVPLWWELPETPVAEGQRWLKAAAERLAPDTPDSVRGWIRFGQSWRDFRFADTANAATALETVELFRRSADKIGLAVSLWRAGSALLTHETLAEAETHLVEAEAVLRDLAPGKWLALALIRLGDLRFRQKRLAQALEHYTEGLSLARSQEFWFGMVNGGSNMAGLLFDLGERERAVRQIEELRDEVPRGLRTSLTSALVGLSMMAGDLAGVRVLANEVLTEGSAIGLASPVAWTLEVIALLAADQGNIEEAGRLAGYTRSVHPSLATRVGTTRVVAEHLYRHLDKVTPEILELAFAEGSRWSLSTVAGRARQLLN